MKPLALVICLLLAALSRQQSPNFSNVEVLYRTTLANSPDSFLAHNNLGDLLMGADRLTEALPHFLEAVRIAPKYLEARINYGMALAMSGQPIAAVEQLEAAVKIKPLSASAHNNLGLALVACNLAGEALGHYHEALRINPTYAAACINLAMANVELGRREQAIAAGRKAMELATAQGDKALAGKIESWLNGYAGSAR